MESESINFGKHKTKEVPIPVNIDDNGSSMQGCHGP